MLMAARHKCFGHVLTAVRAVKHEAVVLLLPAPCWYGSLHRSPPSSSHRDHDAYSTLASQCVKFLSRWSYSAWHLQILSFFVGVYIARNKGADHIHMVPGMFSQVLATTLDLVTVWHNTSLSLLAVGTHGETILWLKRFNLHICAMGWTC